MVLKRYIVLALGLDDIVNAGFVDEHMARVERARLADGIDLNNDDAAVIVHRQRQLQQIAVHRLVLEGDVAVGVGIARVENAGVDVECLIEKVVLAGDIYKLYDVAAVGLCKLVHLAAVLTGVCVGVETDVSDYAGALAADGGQQLAVHAERHGERRYLILAAGSAYRRGHAQVGCNKGLYNALVLDFGKAAAILHEVAGGDAGDDGQIARGVLFSELAAHGFHDAVGGRKRAEAAHAESHTVLYQVSGLGGSNDFCHIVPPCDIWFGRRLLSAAACAVCLPLKLFPARRA